MVSPPRQGRVALGAGDVAQWQSTCPAGFSLQPHKEEEEGAGGGGVGGEVLGESQHNPAQDEQIVSSRLGKTRAAHHSSLSGVLMESCVLEVLT